MSAMPRLYVISDIREDGYVSLSEAQARYLLKVLRLGEGASVKVFNGRDGEWLARIDMVEGRSILLKAERLLRAQGSATAPALTLLFAPLKKTRTDFVVEKATELGAGVIMPVMTERTQAARVRTDRLQTIALEAAEQTERLDLPTVRSALPLAAALDEVGPQTPVLFCDEAAAHRDDEACGDAAEAGPRPIAALLRDLAPISGAVLIGPEGGFSEAERAALAARDTVHAVGLGPRVLRAETAAIAALSIWQAIVGDWT